MSNFFVWVTTRRIKEGALEDLRRAWEPPGPPEGMTRAFEWVAAASNTRWTCARINRSISSGR